VDELKGDPRKAHQKLGWRHETSFDELVAEMVAADLAEARLAGSTHKSND
jgi:GDPmannose 4,6-dehydratase